MLDDPHYQSVAWKSASAWTMLGLNRRSICANRCNRPASPSILNSEFPLLPREELARDNKVIA